jgi:hypothetical protein
MERNIDTRKRDGCEPAFERDTAVALLLLEGTRMAGFDDLD